MIIKSTCHDQLKSRNKVLILMFITLFTCTGSWANYDTPLQASPQGLAVVPYNFKGKQLIQNRGLTECRKGDTFFPSFVHDICSFIGESYNQYQSSSELDAVSTIKEILAKSFKATSFEILQLKNGKGIRGKANLEFQNHQFDLYFGLTSSGNLIYSIPPVGTTLDKVDYSMPDPNDCLSLEMHPLERTSTLHWVNADDNCGLPKARIGTFLVNLSDALNEAHFIKTSKLVDAAIIHCHKGSEYPQASLAFLKMLSTGKTWYEGFGYQQQKVDPNAFEDVKFDLANAKMSFIQQELQALYMNKAPSSSELPFKNHLKSCEKYLPKFASLYGEFLKSGQKTASLGKFLNWVWEKRCDDYPLTMRILFQDHVMDNKDYGDCGKLKTPTSRTKYFQWLNDYRQFNQWNSGLEKKYFSECFKD